VKDVVKEITVELDDIRATAHEMAFPALPSPDAPFDGASSSAPE
jgi:hypothetical protein